MLTDDGPIAIDVPRDREGTFEPQLIPKHARRFTGFDDKILALYARGLTVREIQEFLARDYAIDVSPDLISEVTDAVVAEVTAWQARPLEPMYPVVFFDALRVKIRDEAVVRSKAVYLALGVLPDGTRDILGIVDRADRRREVLAEGVQRPEDARLRGHPDRRHRRPERHARGARRRCIPATTLQTCIVHLIRNSLDFASWKDRKALAAALRPIYTAAVADAARRRSTPLQREPVGPTVSRRSSKPWRRAWDARHPVLRVSAGGAPRDLHDERARERPRARAQDHQDPGPFPDRRGGDQARSGSRCATSPPSGCRPATHWKAAMNQFAILYEDRFLKGPA